MVQHCVDKYGATDVGQWYFEVWNEPDYAGFWNGTITDYYTLYDNAVDGATAVLPNVLIGGPATTEPGKIGAFLQHCKSANKRVTFASSHVYPGGASTGKTASGAGLTNDNNTRTSQITSGGYTTATVKSINTEWNSSYSGQGGGTGDVLVSMDNHWNAGFILKSIKLLSDKNSGDTPPGEIFSYWVLSDVFDESGGSPSNSYILGKGGTLPFGSVFGLMTFQGVRKAAFNAFKMLNYLGPKRLKSSGGTGNDGVDAMATMSAAGDELQILVSDYYATLNTSGTDSVTVTVSNLPASLSGKELFVTHFGVDETHSNPYSVWAGQGKPTAPSETQWQAMRKAQHLALLEPVTKMAVTTSYTTTFTMPRQAGSLIILGVKRPVTGRNALVEIEGEDYDGQSGASKDDSGDVGQGQSLAGTSGGSIFFYNVDFSDAGVASVQLRVNAQSASTLQLHADSATGPTVGTCQIAATSGAWATQTCTLTATTGVHDLYLSFGGAVRLNWMKFVQSGVAPGTGGAGGGSGSGSGGASGTGTGGSVGSGGRGGSAGPTGGTSGGGTGGVAGPGSGGTSVIGTGGMAVGMGTGGTNSGSGGSASPGSGGSSTSGTGGSAGSSQTGASSGKSGCACDVGYGDGSSRTALFVGVAAAISGLRRKKARRRS